MSKKRELEVRHAADRVEWTLKEHGICRLRNDEPGFCFAVGEEIRRRYPLSDLKVESPPRNFGGEYTFSSATHLGTRTSSTKE